jgi:acetyl-CoA carboxylase biotin carboxyl carrier protein
MKPQDIEDLKQLIDFLKEHQVAEFDLDRGDLKIRLKFNPAGVRPAGLGDLAQLLRLGSVSGQWRSAAAAHRHLRLRRLRTGCADPKPGCTSSSRPSSAPSTARPSPGASPFVSPGDHVEKGQVICIVEAMKLMNEIECDAAGEVVKCLCHRTASPSSLASRCFRFGGLGLQRSSELASGAC